MPALELRRRRLPFHLGEESKLQRIKISHNIGASSIRRRNQCLQDRGVFPADLSKEKKIIWFTYIFTRLSSLLEYHDLADLLTILKRYADNNDQLR